MSEASRYEGKNLPKTMPFEEFLRLGWVQEINRLFLHPAGLSLMITFVDVVDGEGMAHVPVGIQVGDHRNLKGGQVFDPEVLDCASARMKAAHVQKEFNDRCCARFEKHGQLLQTIPGREVHEDPIWIEDLLKLVKEAKELLDMTWRSEQDGNPCQICDGHDDECREWCGLRKWRRLYKLWKEGTK